MNNYVFFYLGLSFLLVHEMDAVRCHEWRIFPLLSKLNDKLGATIFILLHIPIILFVFLYLEYAPDIEMFAMVFDLFFIVHLLLHVLYLRHPKNEFKDWVSWAIITGAAIFGLLDLVVRI